MDVLGMKYAGGNIVPKLLKFEQKHHRMDIDHALAMCNDDPDLLKKVITGEKSWTYGYDNETKDQPSQ